MRDLIKNLQANCPPNHYVKIFTLKDEIAVRINKNDFVEFKGKLICLHTNGIVSRIINSEYVVAICYCRELPKNE